MSQDYVRLGFFYRLSVFPNSAESERISFEFNSFCLNFAINLKYFKNLCETCPYLLYIVNKDEQFGWINLTNDYFGQRWVTESWIYISFQNRILTIFNLNKSDWREQQTSAAFLDVSNTASITAVEFSWNCLSRRESVCECVSVWMPTGGGHSYANCLRQHLKATNQTSRPAAKK